ncbi:MAG: hypothetical protein COW55_11520 [Rhodobacteraceae bacterium CG17_big_fil_post_rev_8_21_14_2_50_65_11]|nr:MAG: hypothetical protein COW55_11520 [Rhodobacteraceae bacterium CG17_big_fil_post_rev_8_21_14_2_50_65_11]
MRLPVRCADQRRAGRSGLGRSLDGRGQVTRFLGTGPRLRAFNTVMALLPAASLLPIVMG